MGLLDALSGGDWDPARARARLVDGLERNGYVKSPEVKRAMRAVERHLFVPPSQRAHAYEDRPLPIGYGQTISAPHMVAIMAEALMLEPGMKVLEVGGGLGYHAAVVGHIVAGSGGEGHVYTTELVPELAVRGRSNIEEAALEGSVTYIHCDGGLGLEEHAPFDRIFVACAAPEVPPPLTQQLRDGGLLLIPVGMVHYCDLLRVRRKKRKLVRENLGGCTFVPLVGTYGGGE